MVRDGLRDILVLNFKLFPGLRAEDFLIDVVLGFCGVSSGKGALSELRLRGFCDQIDPMQYVCTAGHAAHQQERRRQQSQKASFFFMFLFRSNRKRRQPDWTV